jgi:nucleoside-diphosphate-sugar epimerase
MVEISGWFQGGRFQGGRFRGRVSSCGRARERGETAMRVLLTGGSGDLGQALVPGLLDRGDTPVILDIRAPATLSQGAAFIEGSVLDRAMLPDAMRGVDRVVHIAAWHGIHEGAGGKSAHDFFDLNVRGTFEIFEAAASVGVRDIVHISTTSVYHPGTLYGRSKILAEQIAEGYARDRGMNVIILRPRGFIPHWNRDVYTRYSDWARWFWKGAVHIDDVVSAVMLSLDHVARERMETSLTLTLDSAYEYTDEDLQRWDEAGAGSTFRKRYAAYYDLAVTYGLNPALKPTKLDISETIRLLGYRPRYSLANLLAELAAHGDRGPPRQGHAPADE